MWPRKNEDEGTAAERRHRESIEVAREQLKLAEQSILWSVRCGWEHMFPDGGRMPRACGERAR